MIVAALTLAARPDQRAEVAAALRAFLGPTRVEPGCTACALYQDVEDADVLHYVEEWSTRWHLEQHLRSTRYERLLRLMEVSTRPPTLKFTWVAAREGLDYVKTVRRAHGDGDPQC